MTRDTDPATGELAPKVRVWLAKPDRILIGRGAVWMGPAFEADLYGEWRLDECRTYPDDDDMQCIRVEGDLLKGPDDAVERPVS